MKAIDCSSGFDVSMVRRSLVLSLTATALPARSQATAKIPRVIAISAGGSPTDEANYVRRREARFRELGWIYGQNLSYEGKTWRGDPAVLQRQAIEIAAMQPDVILAGDNYTVAALLRAGAKSPIVVVVGTNLQEIGWVKSYAHPAGQVTGLAWDQSAEIVGKYPQFLKELVPGLTRLGNLVDLSIPGYQPFQSALERAADRLGITVLTVQFRIEGEWESAFAKLVAERAQGVFIWGSALTYLRMQRLIDLASRHKLPDMTIFRLATELGGLVSYGASITDLFSRSIGHVDKILRGAKPGDLPVELPTIYELVINEKRAKSFGLTIPKSMLALADEVIR